MAAFGGASEATQRDLAALMKLWCESDAAPGIAAAAPAVAPLPTVTCCPPAAPISTADASSSQSFGGRQGWLTDFVAQPSAAPRPAPVPKAAETAAAAAASAGLRCLDASHATSCVKCRAAPPVEDEATWLLVGEAGAKNGEKRLRRLLTRTSQWAKTETRQSTATALEAAPRMDVLARVLRGEANCGDLRKTHLLALCRSWGYRCDIWSQRYEANSARKGEAASRAAAMATTAAARPPRAKRDTLDSPAALPSTLPSPPPPRKRAKAATPAAAGGCGGDLNSLNPLLFGSDLWSPAPLQPLMPAHGFAVPSSTGAGAPPAGARMMPSLHSFAAAHVLPYSGSGTAVGAPAWALATPSAAAQPPARLPLPAPDRGFEAVQPRSASATLEMLPAGLRRAGVQPAAFAASLAPFATAYRTLTAGERARVAANTHGAPFLDARILAELAVSRANLVGAARAFAASAADVKTLKLGGGSSSAGPLPAWLVLDGCDMPGEALCRTLTAACGAAAHETRVKLAEADAAAEAGDLSRTAERIWLADSLRVQHTAVHAMTHASVLLRELQLGHADEFGPAAGALLDAAAVVCAAGVQGVDARTAWVTAHIRATEEADTMLGLEDLAVPQAPLPWRAVRVVINMPKPLRPSGVSTQS